MASTTRMAPVMGVTSEKATSPAMGTSIRRISSLA
jgi:hypothetical protein